MEQSEGQDDGREAEDIETVDIFDLGGVNDDGGEYWRMHIAGATAHRRDKAPARALDEVPHGLAACIKLASFTSSKTGWKGRLADLAELGVWSSGRGVG